MSDNSNEQQQIAKECVNCHHTDLIAPLEEDVCRKCGHYRYLLDGEGKPYKPYSIPEGLKKRLADAQRMYEESQRLERMRQESWSMLSDAEKKELEDSGDEESIETIVMKLEERKIRKWQEAVNSNMNSSGRTRARGRKALREINVPKAGKCPKCSEPVESMSQWVGDGTTEPMICRQCYYESQRKKPTEEAVSKEIP